MTEQISNKRLEELKREGAEFDRVMKKYGIDPDKTYYPDHPKYNNYLKAREELGYNVLTDSDIKKIGLLKLKFMVDEVFLNPYRVSKLRRQITYSELTDPFDESVKMLCEFAGVDHSYFIKSIITKKNSKGLPFREKETREETLKYLDELKTYRLLCSMIKEEYQAKGGDTYLFFDDTLDVLAEKKKEYDDYWTSINRQHIIDKIPLKRYGNKTTLKKLIGV